MVKIVTPTDVALQVVDYANGVGSYTTAVKVAALLGIADFSASTSPRLPKFPTLFDVLKTILMRLLMILGEKI